ncbi:hypothetical protein [Nocardioides daejeonensis]|uniref:hypothetical protein n=1 Tax=Nocardioides daejeonensis TaxID=1046556 RepID=UPI000D74DD0E|nr:hypothetical protein [Nocardioides daejeonensis]
MTTTMTHLPALKEVRDLFADLLGRDVTLSTGAPLAPGARTPASIGVYVDDSLQISALVVADLPFSAYAGAAIGLLPPGRAGSAIEEGAIDETLAENLYEVLNIAASLFNAPGATHLRLYSVSAAGGPVDPQILARALTLGRREDTVLDVAGYGTGRLSIVML